MGETSNMQVTKEDPRILRTRKLLLDAFIKVIQKKVQKHNHKGHYGRSNRKSSHFLFSFSR